MLVHVVGGAHNDGLTMLLATLGVAAVLSAREVAGGFALLAAVAIKISAAFVAPFALLGAARSAAGGAFQRDPHLPAPARGRRLGRLLAGVVAAGVAIGAASYLAFGWEWLDALDWPARTRAGRATSACRRPSPASPASAPDPVRTAALVLFAVLIASLLAWTWRGGDWVRAAAWAAFGLLLASSWLLPWYLIWPLPLVAISSDRLLQLLTLALTAYQLGARIPL